MADITRSIELTAALSPDYQKAFKAASDQANTLGKDIKSLEKEQILLKSASEGDAKALKKLGISSEQAKGKLQAISEKIAILGRHKKDLDHTAEINKTALSLDRLQRAYDKLKDPKLGAQLDAMKAKAKSLGIQIDAGKTSTTSRLKAFSGAIRSAAVSLASSSPALSKAKSVFSGISAPLIAGASAFSALGAGAAKTAVKVALGAAAVAGLGFSAFKTASDLKSLGLSAIEAADNIAKESAALGINAESYQELAYAMRRGGASTEGFSKAIKTLDAQMDSARRGDKAAIALFKEFGFSVSDIKNKNPEEVFLQVADALEKIDDPVQTARKGAQLFGKEGYRLTKAMSVGSKGLGDLRREARKLGLVMMDAELEAGEAGADAIENLNSAFEGMKSRLGVAVMPELTGALQKITSLITENKDVIDAVSDTAKAFFGVFTGGVSLVVDGVQSMLDGWRFAKNAVADFLLWADEGVKSLVEMISGLPDKLRDIGAKAIRALGDGISSAFDYLSGKINELTDSSPVLKSIFSGAQSVGEFVSDGVGAVSDIASKAVSTISNVFNVTNNVDARGASPGVSLDVTRALNAIPNADYTKGYLGRV